MDDHTRAQLTEAANRFTFSALRYVVEDASPVLAPGESVPDWWAEALADDGELLGRVVTHVAALGADPLTVEGNFDIEFASYFNYMTLASTEDRLARYMREEAEALEALAGQMPFGSRERALVEAFAAHRAEHAAQRADA